MSAGVGTFSRFTNDGMRSDAGAASSSGSPPAGTADFCFSPGKPFRVNSVSQIDTQLRQMEAPLGPVSRPPFTSSSVRPEKEQRSVFFMLSSP